METQPPARVFTVVLNYRTHDDTLRCLESLSQSTRRSQFPVVVDNASGPEAVERLRAGLPATTLLVSGENLGYAGGNNLAIRYALERDAEFVWILNPDTSVEAATLEQLLDTARRRPEAGLLGPRVLYGGSRPLTVSSDGGRIDWQQGGATSNRNDGVAVTELPDEGAHEVDYVTGSSLLVRAEVFEDVGLLPEEYFLYFEETEFACRAAAAGWAALVDVGARIHHYKRSFGPLPEPYYVYYYLRARLLFAQRCSDADPGTVEASLDHFVLSWRDRVGRHAPGWLDTYDWLVDQAFADGHAGRTGRRDEIHAVASPSAAVTR